MTLTPGRFAGSGTLQPLTGNSPAPIAVEFSFDIVAIPLPRRPGLPPPPSQLKGHGKVSLPTGVNLEDGRYRVRASNGEELRVVKLGAEWQIVAPVP